jgi:hypothetical protein
MATSNFGKAFAAARKSGQKTFEFNGKKYSTETRDDVVRRRNEAVGRNSTAGEKTATTKAREYTSGLAKEERAAERQRDSDSVQTFADGGMVKKVSGAGMGCGMRGDLAGKNMKK